MARALLLMAHFGKEGKPEEVIAKVSQQTLAEMIGTIRSRVSFFMTRFKKMGLIHYDDGLHVHSSLLNCPPRLESRIAADLGRQIRREEK